MKCRKRHSLYKHQYIVFILAMLVCVVSITACTGKNVQTAGTDERENEQQTQQTDSESKDLSAEAKLEQAVLAAKVELPEEKTINFKAIGDVMLGRGVRMRLKGDYLYPFKEVAQYLNDADIMFANLESSISTRGEKLIGKGVWLQAEPKAVEGIKSAGVDILNIANNHIMDFNEIAMFDTIEILDEHNLHHIGAGKNLEEARKPVILEAKGNKIGFIGYTDLYQYGYGVPGQKGLRYPEAKEDVAGVAPLKYDIIEEDIKKLREQVDVLVVSLHWGIEESHKVPPEQREFAYQVLDAGADIILGHHPHQLQGIEIYEGKPIIYSMGNFIFDQNDKENNETMIVDVDFMDGKVSRLEIVPCQIVGKTQTVFAQEEQAAHILGYLKKFSEQLDTTSEIKENKLVFELN